MRAHSAVGVGATAGLRIALNASVGGGRSHATGGTTLRAAADAIAFYKKALDAQEIYRLAMPDGRVGHAELHIEDVSPEEITKRMAAM